MAVNLTYWLRKTPQPTALLADDQRIEVPRNRRAWRDLTATIASLEPAKLTALDAKDHVIRSIVLESDDDGDDKKSASPEMTDLQLFARLLSEGYEKGMKANQPVIDSAMRFVETQSQRLLKAESEIDRLRGVIHRQHMQLAELNGAQQPAGDADGSVLGTLVASAMAAAAGGGNPNPLAVVGKSGAKK